MNKEEIIEMAREAGFDPHDMSSDFTCNLENINAFAKLVAEKAIKEALAQPEQEPVAMKFKIYKPTVPDPLRQDINNALLPWVYDQDRSSGFDATMWVTPVATLPPQRTWVGLTDEEIIAVNMSTVTKLIDEPIVCDTDHNIIQLGKAIEAKLKQKNGYSEDKNTRGKND